MSIRDGYMLGLGAVGPWVLAVVLHRLTQRRLPVRTDFLLAPPFVGPIVQVNRDRSAAWG